MIDNICSKKFKTVSFFYSGTKIMQGEYRTKFILALLGHACLGLSSKKCELLPEANDGQNQINLIFTKNDKTHR